MTWEIELLSAAALGGSSLCLLVAVLARPRTAARATQAGTGAALGAAFLLAPQAGPLTLTVALAAGAVAAVGLGSALGLLNPR